MYALLSLLRLKNEYRLEPNENAILTRGRSLLALPAQDERTSARLAQFSSHFSSHSSSHSSSLAGAPEGPLLLMRPLSHNETGSESVVYRAPLVSRMSREAIRSLFQCENGNVFSPLVRDLRERCMRWRGEVCCGWRPVTEVRGGGAKASEHSAASFAPSPADTPSANGSGEPPPGTTVFLDRPKYRTYTQLWERIVCFSCGLRAMGLKSGDMVGICEDSRWESLVTCYAAWAQRFVCVILRDDAACAARAISEVDLAVLVCGRRSQPALAAHYAHSSRRPPVFVVTDPAHRLDRAGRLWAEGAEGEEEKAAAENVVAARSWESVLEAGRTEWRRRRSARRVRQTPFSLSTAAPHTPRRNVSEDGGEVAAPRRSQSAGGVQGSPPPAQQGGEEEDAILHFPTSPTELAAIFYRSGDPRGVMLSHGAMKAAVMAFHERLDSSIIERRFHFPPCMREEGRGDRETNGNASSNAFPATSHFRSHHSSMTRPPLVGDGYGRGHSGTQENSSERPTYLSYLPFARMSEFISQHTFLHRGYIICFSHPLTLFQRQNNVTVSPHGDLREFKPRVLSCVPQFLNSLREMLESTIPQTGFLSKVFHVAYEERRRAIERCFETPFLNDTVFAEPRTLLGGRCSVLVCVGGPLQAATQEFIEVVCGVPIVQSYALTETAGVGTLQYTWDTEHRECVGGLLGAVELKLRDVGPWRHTNKWPSGEALLRGPTLMSGYFSRPADTARVVDEDGWLHTGDVLEIQVNGSFRVVARLKHVVKNTHGDYVNLEALEEIYALHPLCLHGGVCVLAHPYRSYVVALVLSTEANVSHFIAGCAELREQIGETRWPFVLREPALNVAAAEALAAHALAAGSKPHECVRRVRVLYDEWCSENGILNWNGSINRPAVEERYAGLIAELFCEVE